MRAVILKITTSCYPLCRFQFTLRVYGNNPKSPKVRAILIIPSLQSPSFVCYSLLYADICHSTYDLVDYSFQGFENFFPKGTPKNEKKEEQGSDSSKQKEEANSSQKDKKASEKTEETGEKSRDSQWGQKSKGAGGGPGPGPDSNNQQIGGLTALAILLALITTLMSDEQLREGGREVCPR